MHSHTWEDPEIYQIWTVNKISQNNWPKESQKKWPLKLIQTILRILSDTVQGRNKKVQNKNEGKTCIPIKKGVK